VQVLGEDPRLVLSFVVWNETVMVAGLLDAVPQIGALCQTFRGVIFWRKRPFEAEWIVRARPEREGKEFPRRNARGIEFGDDTVVAVVVAVRNIVRGRDHEFDEVREHFVELSGVYERRMGRVDDGISHVGQR